MISNILARLGLVKISTNKALDYVYSFNEDFTKRLLNDSDLNLADKPKAQVEMKVFFWVYVQPFVKDYFKNDRLVTLSEFYQNTVLLSSLTESERHEIDAETFLMDRFKFHAKGIPTLNNSGPSNPYVMNLNRLWFKEPFSEIGSDEEMFRKNFSFDFIDSSMSQMRVLTLIKHMGPPYKKAMKALARMWKN